MFSIKKQNKIDEFPRHPFELQRRVKYMQIFSSFCFDLFFTNVLFHVCFLIDEVVLNSLIFLFSVLILYYVKGIEEIVGGNYKANDLMWIKMSLLILSVN